MSEISVKGVFLYKSDKSQMSAFPLDRFPGMASGVDVSLWEGDIAAQ